MRTTIIALSALGFMFPLSAKAEKEHAVVASVMTNKTGGKRLSRGERNDANSRVFVALPSTVALGRTVTVIVPENGAVAKNIPVRDVGPWNRKDAYWLRGKRPMAEYGYSDKYGKARNPAGIDLSLKLCKELGLRYPYLGKVKWMFDDQS